MIQVVEGPIQPAAIYDLLAKNGAGSVLLHYAVVKETPHNQATSGPNLCPSGNSGWIQYRFHMGNEQFSPRSRKSRACAEA